MLSMALLFNITVAFDDEDYSDMNKEKGADMINSKQFFDVLLR